MDVAFPLMFVAGGAILLVVIIAVLMWVVMNWKR